MSHDATLEELLQLDVEDIARSVRMLGVNESWRLLLAAAQRRAYLKTPIEQLNAAMLIQITLAERGQIPEIVSEAVATSVAPLVLAGWTETWLRRSAVVSLALVWLKADGMSLLAAMTIEAALRRASQAEDSVVSDSAKDALARKPPVFSVSLAHAGQGDRKEGPVHFEKWGSPMPPKDPALIAMNQALVEQTAGLDVKK